MLKVIAEKLDHFITEYPWAGNAIRALSIVIKSVNVAGFAVALANEAKNMITGELAAPAVRKIITEAAQGIKEFDPTLTDREAVVLAGSALATAGIVADAKSVLRSMKNILGKLDTGGGLAYAGMGSSKFKLDEFNAVQGGKPHTFTPHQSGGPSAHTGTDSKKVFKQQLEGAIPEGVPSNWIITTPDKGSGLKYVNPNNPHEYVRSMKGNPKNPNIDSQNPYIAWHKNGKRLDINGNTVDKYSREAHIDPNKFVYKVN